MPRSAATAVENSFVNGVITEATALNFPESAATESSNVIFTRRGLMTRRLGFDYEPSFTLANFNRSDKAISSYFWLSAGGSGVFNFLVSQIGDTLSFYNLGADGNLSANLSASTVGLSAFAIAGAPATREVECQFASGNGYLFVVHPYCTPFYISYNPADNTFSSNNISIKIRDVVGVDDGGAVGRDTSITHPHYYNLLNQGWTPSTINTFYASQAYFPNNADVWWLFINAVTGTFDPTLASTIVAPVSPAPKGAFTFDAFNQDRAARSGLGDIPSVTSGYHRPSTVEFYSGRVFYAGVNALGFFNNIYFSQTVESSAQFGACMQQNDPTDQFSFDVLATDGGVLTILEAGAILKLVSISGALIVFASNGIWSIAGSLGSGFSATDFVVRKISNVPCVSASSFISVNGAPVWWNTDGIYTLSLNSTLGQAEITSISDARVKTLFTNILADTKRYARGAYDPVTHVCQWLYRSTDSATVEDRYTFDSVLCLNTFTGAFYTYALAGPVHLHGIVCVSVLGTTSTSTNVTDGLGGIVVDHLGANVTTTTASSLQVPSTFKYLVSSGVVTSANFTIAMERDHTYTDWVSAGGNTDFISYALSGYKVHGDGQRKFQANYVSLYCENAVNSSVNIQARWDYASSLATGKWSSTQLLTFTSTSYSTRKRRVKLRGSGVACQFALTSVSGQPFNIVGWSVYETGNAGP